MKLAKSNITFDARTHTYTTSAGAHPIGVTSLLKKHGLSPDYSAVPQAVLEAAAERGTLLHNAIEDYTQGLFEESLAAPLEVECVKRWTAFAEKNNLPSVEEVEYLVTDPDNVAASKTDIVFADGSLADIKTTSTLHTQSVSWQLSIYAYMFERMNPSEKVPALYCIHYTPAKGFALVPLARIADEEVERLLDCEKRGELYTPSASEEEEREREEAVAIVMSNNLPAVMGQIAQLEDALKELKAQRDAVYSTLYEKMSERQLSKIEGDGFTITRKAPYERSTIDSAALKADLPDIAEKYTKTTTVAGSVTIKIVNN